VKRIPEPEVMDDVLEAESYASEAALAYLSRIDDTFVERFLRIGLKDGLVLDLGSGPGVIPIKIALKCKGLEVLGVDLSEAMLQIARKTFGPQGLVLACGLQGPMPNGWIFRIVPLMPSFRTHFCTTFKTQGLS